MTSSKKTVPLFLFLVLIFTVAILFTSCGAAQNETEELTVESFNGKTVGVNTGTVHEGIAKEHFPDSEIKYFYSNSELAQATDSGIISGFTCDYLIARDIHEEIPSLKALSPGVGVLSGAVAFPKTEKGDKLRNQMNEFLKKCRDNGTMKELNHNWLDEDAPQKPIDFSGSQKEGASDMIFNAPQRPNTKDFIFKYKHLSYKINRKDFDLMALQGEIQSFADKYGLSKNVCFRLQICTEETVYLLLEQIQDDGVDLEIKISFSDIDKTCRLEFASRGECFDPFEKMDKDKVYDNLGLLIVHKKSKSYSHTYADGVNYIALNL